MAATLPTRPLDNQTQNLVFCTRARSFRTRRPLGRRVSRPSTGAEFCFRTPRWLASRGVLARSEALILLATCLPVILRSVSVAGPGLLTAIALPFVLDLVFTSALLLALLLISGVLGLVSITVVLSKARRFPTQPYFKTAWLCSTESCPPCPDS